MQSRLYPISSNIKSEVGRTISVMGSSANPFQNIS